MIGTLINVVLVIVGCSLGLLLRKGVPDRVKNAVMMGMGLCVILIGISGALKTNDTMCVIVCMAVGGIIGSILDIEKKLDTFGRFVERRFGGDTLKEGSGSISKAFVTSSLIYCVGAMAIVGAIDSAIRGDHSTLIAKGIIDGVTAIIFTSTMGIGVFLSAGAVLVYQGLIAILAGWLSPILTDAMITEIGAVGNLLVVAIGLNMIYDNKHIPVGNLLPAIFLPMLYLPLTALFG